MDAFMTGPWPTLILAWLALAILAGILIGRMIRRGTDDWPGPETHGDGGGHPHIIMGDEARARWISDLQALRNRQGSRAPHLRPIAGGAAGRAKRRPF